MVEKRKSGKVDFFGKPLVGQPGVAGWYSPYLKKSFVKAKELRISEENKFREEQTAKFSPWVNQYVKITYESKQGRRIDEMFIKHLEAHHVVGSRPENHYSVHSFTSIHFDKIIHIGNSSESSWYRRLQKLKKEIGDGWVG